MPSIPDKKIEGYSFNIWEHCDIMNKTVFHLFLKNASKPSDLTDYCSGKGMPMCRAKWNLYILCIDKRWKVYLKINLLDTWALCFLKGKLPEFAHFFNEINVFAILCQLHYLLVLHRIFFRSSWCILGFVIYVSIIWMPH
jgi:hypothetical protein